MENEQPNWQNSENGECGSAQHQNILPAEIQKRGGVSLPKNFSGKKINDLLIIFQHLIQFTIINKYV